MTVHVRVPRDNYFRQRPVRAAARFYWLLDCGMVHTRGREYAGNVALNTVAEEYHVPLQTVWRWVREFTEVGRVFW